MRTPQLLPAVDSQMCQYNDYKPSKQKHLLAAKHTAGMAGLSLPPPGSPRTWSLCRRAYDGITGPRALRDLPHKANRASLTWTPSSLGPPGSSPLHSARPISALQPAIYAVTSWRALTKRTNFPFWEMTVILLEPPAAQVIYRSHKKWLVGYTACSWKQGRLLQGGRRRVRGRVGCREGGWEGGARRERARGDCRERKGGGGGEGKQGGQVNGEGGRRVGCWGRDGDVRWRDPGIRASARSKCRSGSGRQREAPEAEGCVQEGNEVRHASPRSLKHSRAQK